MNENEKREIVERVTKELSILQKSVYNTKEAARYLGLSVSMVHKLTSWKRIPYFKPEGCRFNYYNREELDAWRMRNRVATNEELEGRARMIAKRG